MAVLAEHDAVLGADEKIGTLAWRSQMVNDLSAHQTDDAIIDPLTQRTLAEKPRAKRRPARGRIHPPHRVISPSKIPRIALIVLQHVLLAETVAVAFGWLLATSLAARS
jgi:hypothetical protein